MAEELLTLPAARAARQLIRGFLDDAKAARERLEEPADTEALHDFRVALRRLRSTERAYRPHLEEVLGKKLRKHVKAIASATGPARDAEVQLVWLDNQRDMIKSHERPGFQYLYRRLRARKEEEYGHVREHVAPDFDRVSSRLGERLDLSYADDEISFGEVAAGLIREATSEFAEHLQKVHGEADEQEVHQARIAGKRIRYLLEPLRDSLDKGKDLVKELKGLQDLMGEIHDIQVLSAELTEASEEAGANRFRQLIDLSLNCGPHDPELEAARRRDERAGLMTLARELHERHQDLFSRLLGKLEAGDATLLVEHLMAAADALAPQPEETDAEADGNNDAG